MRLFEGTEFDVPPWCERCNALEADCACEPLPAPSIPPEKQTVRIVVENRKRGKTMTVVRGLAEDPAPLASLLTQLKNLCGGGGTIRDGNLEIQGSHAVRIEAALKAMQYRVK